MVTFIAIAHHPHRIVVCGLATNATRLVGIFPVRVTLLAVPSGWKVAFDEACAFQMELGAGRFAAVFTADPLARLIIGILSAVATGFISPPLVKVAIFAVPAIWKIPIFQAYTK